MIEVRYSSWTKVVLSSAVSSMLSSPARAQEECGTNQQLVSTDLISLMMTAVSPVSLSFGCRSRYGQ